MLLGLVLLIVAAPLQATEQTTTDCTATGQTMNCTSRTDSAAPGPGQQLLDNMAQQNREQAAQQAIAANGAADRRAAAYAQVGALIAKGDCAGAKRLAAFYGHSDIVKATARACPAE